MSFPTYLFNMQYDCFVLELVNQLFSSDFVGQVIQLAIIMKQLFSSDFVGQSIHLAIIMKQLFSCDFV